MHTRPKSAIHSHNFDADALLVSKSKLNPHGLKNCKIPPYSKGVTTRCPSPSVAKRSRGYARSTITATSTKRTKKVRPISAPSDSTASQLRIPRILDAPETIPVPQLQMDALNCPNYTSTEYWDTMGKNWTGEIMSSIDEDVNGIIKHCLDNYCARSPGSLAVDFGCGVGLYIPSLAARCENVVGLDISRRLIALARKDCDRRGLTGVRFKRSDLGTCDIRKLGLEGRVNLAVCANVLISPQRETRRAIMHNVVGSLQKGGHLLLVIPAVRSALLCQQAHSVWLAERHRLRVRPCKGVVEYPEATTPADERRGIFRRDGVRTKHFRQAELRKILAAHMLELILLDRVEYDWLTEFQGPVDILEKTFAERPFDWIAIARKV